MTPVILLGLGFTTRRLARRLLLRSAPVFAVARQPGRFESISSAGVQIAEYSPEGISALPKGGVLVHTIPPLDGAESDNVRDIIRSLEPRRVIYISSTSVYGELAFVDAASAAVPSEIKGFRRLEEEIWLTNQAVSTLIVRPAAIYGPGRGVHVRVREGKPQRTSGETVVSRIHADDLAAILDAGVNSALEGAWPCADDYPCSTDEISFWCSGLLEIKTVTSLGKEGISGRTVDGRRIRELLGVDLQYPGYAPGILASLAEETGGLSALRP